MSEFQQLLIDGMQGNGRVVITDLSPPPLNIASPRCQRLRRHRHRFPGNSSRNCLTFQGCQMKPNPLMSRHLE